MIIFYSSNLFIKSIKNKTNSTMFNSSNMRRVKNNKWVNLLQETSLQNIESIQYTLNYTQGEGEYREYTLNYT